MTAAHRPGSGGGSWSRPGRRPRQRGAAILTAMIIVTIVSTLAAGMVWKQWRAVQVESAERARLQSAWILTGALDWARLILREDARTGGADHLGEPWAVPLAEARLSTFLAADRRNTLVGDGPEAFLSGSIVDAQSRFNLTNLLDQSDQVEADIQVLERLCEQLALPPSTARQIATALRRAHGIDDSGGSDGPLSPRTVDQLAWLGISETAIAQLRPYVTMLPVRTPVNMNTAERELLGAVLDIDLASAERLVRERQTSFFRSPANITTALGRTEGTPNPRLASVASAFYEVRGRLRLEDRIVEEWSLVERRGLQMRVIQRERRSLLSEIPS